MFCLKSAATFFGTKVTISTYLEAGERVLAKISCSMSGI
jgi:hypothetical protein